MKERILSISEAAKQLNVESHVLRYWEEELDMVVPRNEMGHRLYGEREMQLLHSVKELKMQGFQLRAIKLLLQELKEGETLEIGKIIAMREEIHKKAQLEDYTKMNTSQETFHTPKAQGHPNNRENMQEYFGQAQNKQDNGGEKVQDYFGQWQDRKGYRDSLEKAQAYPKRVENMPQYSNREERISVYSGQVQNVQGFSSGAMQQEKKEQGLAPERVKQFQYIMLQIMNNALKENNLSMTQQIQEYMQKTLNEELPKKISCLVEQNLGDHVSDDVSTRIIKELNYITRMQEEREETHFQQIDAMLRGYQEHAKGGMSARQRKKMQKKQEKLVAAANEEPKSGKKLFKKKK